jgi:hypothetical protein
LALRAELVAPRSADDDAQHPAPAQGDELSLFAAYPAHATAEKKILRQRCR